MLVCVALSQIPDFRSGFSSDSSFLGLSARSIRPRNIRITTIYMTKQTEKFQLLCEAKFLNLSKTRFQRKIGWIAKHGTQACQIMLLELELGQNSANRWPRVDVFLSKLHLQGKQFKILNY
ncbi:hypothetical protein H5410_061717 [Solanum commersonii]|uniref:Uncharacterized protein n=1 Tax=Solanum commersonii TaxID=4109 RepID=A0A9J5W9F4_SOLCO|nr:hypothetical protein H5410_061717 [Solanum commersonii]